MQKVKTNELTGAALDWAVAAQQCDEGWLSRHLHLLHTMPFSTDWSQGGPIIERDRITLRVDSRGGNWVAFLDAGRVNARNKGPTPLIAAMRCYVASKMGDTIEVPEELTQ